MEFREGVSGVARFSDAAGSAEEGAGEFQGPPRYISPWAMTLSITVKEERAIWYFFMRLLFRARSCNMRKMWRGCTATGDDGEGMNSIRVGLALVEYHSPVMT